MLYLLLLASLLHVPALGVLGEPCGETVQTHTLTQALTQTNPTNGNVTQTYQLNWTSMVIHINILTMAAPREDPHRDPEEDPPRDPRGDPPGRPVPVPRAIQLTVKYPSFNWEGIPMSSLKLLNKELKYSWRAHMRITKNQTR